MENVYQYFDKAGDATNISKDMLNFLKSPDYSLKFNIPYRTGFLFCYIQIQELFKLCKLLEFSIKLTDFQQKVEQDIPLMFLLNKQKP